MPHTTPERLLNAIKIDPHTQTITSIQVANRFAGPNGMYQHMGCDLIEHYPVTLPQGDLLLCDEEALLKNEVPCFAFGNFIVTGTALIVGDSPQREYSDVKMPLEVAKRLVQFPA